MKKFLIVLTLFLGSITSISAEIKRIVSGNNNAINDPANSKRLLP